MDILVENIEMVVAVGSGLVGAAGTMGMMIYRRGVQFNILQKEIKDIKDEYEDLKEQNRKDHETVKSEQAKLWSKLSKVSEDVSYIRGILENKKRV